jgi:hypothetical protein
VFVAGLRTIDRVRGGGWLDCPHCGEHASQDVVDEMRFLGLLGYRFTTVGRRRVLVCRRCGFRRTAGGVELGRLNTAGRRIQRAWLIPVGLLPFAAVAAAAVFVLGRHPAGIEDTLSFTRDSAQPVAPVSLRRPLSWNASPEADSTPPDYAVSDPTQRMVFKLRRITDSGSLAQLLAVHYMDDNGINDTGVPDSPPGATTVQIAGGTGLMIHFSYSSTGEPAQTTFYAFFHDGIGYTLTYVAKGTAQFSTLDQVADTVNRSLSFTGTETPASCPSPSASPSPAAAATAIPGATPSATFPGFATSPQPCVGAVGAETPPSSPSASASPSASH